ncbi:MAG: hypothetical protein K6A65_07000 [Succinivibrionaceae bacterium]|nr:hypothetical protein [Succinivibrionaceae bacterium]
MSDNNTNNYLEDLQKPSGWFELIHEIIKMMSVNSRGDEYLRFLQETGRRVAEQYPVPELSRIEDLRLSINARLDKFKWGYADIIDSGDSLLIRHHCMPRHNPGNIRDPWPKAFAYVLCGLYGGWFRSSGAPATLVCTVESVDPPAGATFRLQHS